VVLLCLLVAVGTVLTTINPITVTEYSLVFSAVALPLTYLPILVIANDPDYMGARVNGRVANLFGTVFLVVILVASLAAIPLMLATRAGQ
jgi:manganese transport protein